MTVLLADGLCVTQGAVGADRTITHTFHSSEQKITNTHYKKKKEKKESTRKGSGGRQESRSTGTKLIHRSM